MCLYDGGALSNNVTLNEPFDDRSLASLVEESCSHEPRYAIPVAIRPVTQIDVGRRLRSLDRFEIGLNRFGRGAVNQQTTALNQ